MLIDPYTWHNVKILHKIVESPDAVTIVTSRPSSYTFTPGQHAIMRAPIRADLQLLRQYSFSNCPTHQELHFTVTRSPGGAVSNWLIDDASKDCTVDISQPFTGPLAIESHASGPIGFIAGGSGIGPIMSHIRTLRHSRQSGRFSLLYSTRGSTRCFAKELAPHSDNESITTVITDEATRASADDVVRSMNEAKTILICGSRPFVTAMANICKDAFPGVPIHAEAFSLS